jgi:Mn2+/Fe2+ NRAMP family transporter
MLGNVVLNLLSLFVIILLGPALVMGILANNPGIMGEYKSNSLQNVVYWSSITFIFILGLLSQLS